jgi:membrane protein
LTSGPHFHATRDLVARLPLGLGELLSLLFRFLPFLILSLAFAVFYQLMPNTKVQWRAALVGGIVGGCLWQINNMMSVFYVSRVVTNNKIYGSLGMVPVVMIGFYFSWIILLFGAQVTYAFQNRRTYLQERLSESVHQCGREFAALRLVTRIGQRFQQREKPPTLTELTGSLGVPTRLAGQILNALVGARLVVETADAEIAYLPARPLNQISAHEVIQALRAGQGMALTTEADSAREFVRSQFERIGEAEKAVAGSITIQEMVERLQAEPTKLPAQTPSA